MIVEPPVSKRNVSKQTSSGGGNFSNGLNGQTLRVSGSVLSGGKHKLFTNPSEAVLIGVAKGRRFEWVTCATKSALVDARARALTNLEFALRLKNAPGSIGGSLSFN